MSCAAKGVRSDLKAVRLLTLGAAIVIMLGFGPPAMPQQLLDQKALSYDMARSIAQAAIEKCRADGYHVSVTVLDGSGRPQAFGRDDGALLNTVDVSRSKAYTAFMYRRPSAETAKAWAANPPAFKIEGTIGLPGGLPINVGKDVIGAIGVAGAPGGDKDEACASDGISKFADKLR